MGRPIKFRAWDKEIKQMLGPKTWDQLMDRDGGDFFFNNEYSRREKDHDFVLMQFTGLHDSTGREIYEGDIVKGGWDCQDGRQVVFEDGGFEPFSRASGQEGEKPLWVEVIGNVHENPELLK